MGERGEHRHREGVDVIERQHREHPVAFVQAVLGADRRRVRGEVRLRQHHALGHAGGARGVHQQCHGVRWRRVGRRLAAFGRAGRDLAITGLGGAGLPGSGPGSIEPAGICADRVRNDRRDVRRIRRRHHDRDLPAEPGDEAAHALLPVGGDEHQLAVGVVEHVAHLLGLRQQVHRVHADAGVHGTEQQPQRLQPVRQHQ